MAVAPLQTCPALTQLPLPSRGDVGLRSPPLGLQSPALGTTGCLGTPRGRGCFTPRAPGTPRSLGTNLGVYDFHSIDQFLILKSLGKGTFASVRQAVHRDTGRVFALKTVRRDRVLAEGGSPEVLKREADVQLRMRHRNIVQLHGHFEEKGELERTHFVLEFVAGGQLLDFMRKHGRLSSPQAACMFLDVTLGLIFIHDHKIVHRDIKPENVLLHFSDKSDMPVAKIGDFGCCAVMTECQPTRSTICGTMDYLAPEMIDQQPHDHRVDVWAVGVLLYEMLVGEPPFKAKSQLEALRRIVNTDLRLPSYLDANAATLIRALLQKESARRLLLKEATRHAFVSRNTDADVTSNMAQPAVEKSFTAPAFPSLGLGSGAVTPREAARQAAAHDGRPLGSGAVTPMAAERQAAVPKLNIALGSASQITAVAAAPSGSRTDPLPEKGVERRSISPLRRPMPMSARFAPRAASRSITPQGRRTTAVSRDAPQPVATSQHLQAIETDDVEHEIATQANRGRETGASSLACHSSEPAASTHCGETYSQWGGASSAMSLGGSFSSSRATAGGFSYKTTASRLRSLTPDHGELEETLKRDANVLPMPEHVAAGHNSPTRELSPLVTTPRQRPLESPAGGQPRQPSGSPVARAPSPKHVWAPLHSDLLTEDTVGVCVTTGRPRAKAASSRKVTQLSFQSAPSEPHSEPRTSTSSTPLVSERSVATSRSSYVAEDGLTYFGRDDRQDY